MARVWAAWDNHFECACALKLGLSDDNGHLLVEEHERLRTLDHPGVVRELALYMLYDDLGEDLGPGLALEALEGPSLRALIKKRVSPAQDEMRDVVANFLSALAHVHERGIVHGDLRPDNIMLRRPDDLTSVTLIDFGPNDTHTSFEGINARYWSPERLSKTRPGPSRADDVYALGLILAYWSDLTNVVPANWEDQVVWYGSLASDVARSVSTPQEPELGVVITEMLTLNPDARPSAQQLLERLEDGARDDLPQVASSTGLAKPAYTALVGWLIVVVLALSWLASETLRSHSSQAQPPNYQRTQNVPLPIAEATSRQPSLALEISKQMVVLAHKRAASVLEHVAEPKKKPTPKTRRHPTTPRKKNEEEIPQEAKPVVSNTKKPKAKVDSALTKECVINPVGPPTCYEYNASKKDLEP